MLSWMKRLAVRGAFAQLREAIVVERGGDCRDGLECLPFCDDVEGEVLVANREISA